MLSKNFEYTGQRLYLSNIALPISVGAGFGHGVAQRELARLRSSTVAQAFVRRAVVVGRFGGAGKPALVDSAAVGAVGIPIAGCSLMRLPGCKKLRGTQVGVSRNSPSPASIAELSSEPTLSFFTRVEVVDMTAKTSNYWLTAGCPKIGDPSREEI